MCFFLNLFSLAKLRINVLPIIQEVMMIEKNKSS